MQSDGICTLVTNNHLWYEIHRIAFTTEQTLIQQTSYIAP